MLKLIVVAVALALAQAAVDIKFQDCGNGNIQSLNVDECSDANHCEIKRGTTPKMVLSFKSPTKITSGKVDVKAKVGILPTVDFPLPDPKLCDSASCPIEAGTEGAYTLSLPIKSIYPAAKAIITMTLTDQDKKTAGCVKFIVYIK